MPSMLSGGGSADNGGAISPRRERRRRRIRFSNPSLESLFCVRQASSPFLNLRQGYFNMPAARI